LFGLKPLFVVYSRLSVEQAHFVRARAHAFSALGFWKKFFPKYTGRVSMKRTPAFRL